MTTEKVTRCCQCYRHLNEKSNVCPVSPNDPKYRNYIKRAIEYEAFADEWGLCEFCNDRINGGYIDFGDFARGELGLQCQYASYYIDGLAGYPKLCKGLRIKQPVAGMYHNYIIHKDDAKILKERVTKWRNSYQ